MLLVSPLSMTLIHLQHLGFRVNWNKSHLTPAQLILYLGLDIDFMNMKEKFHKGAQVSVRCCMRLLGLLAAASNAVPLGFSRMREILSWFATLHADPVRERHKHL